MEGEGVGAEAGAELKERFSKSRGDKPTDRSISLAEVRTMFGLPPASVLELPDPEEHGRSLLHRAAHAGRPNLCKALLELIHAQELAQKERQVTEKDEALKAKDAELELLRARLAMAEEGVPPSEGK